MTASTSSTTENHYDVVVIGSGAAGLTTATRLSKAGLKTILLEKNDWLGGYSHGFSKDGFYWDHGGHIFLAYRLGAQAREVFQRLKLDQIVEMVPDKHDYRCIFPDESLSIMADITEAGDVFAQRFPEERDGIAKVLLTMESLIDEVDMFVPSFRVAVKPGQRGILDPIKEQFQRPRLSSAVSPLLRGTHAPGGNLTKYQSKTLTDLLDEHLKSPRLKGYFSMLSAGIGAPPGKLSAVIAGVFFIHALRTQWMPMGGFGKLGEALAGMIQEAGGEIATGAKAVKIRMRDGRVAGVETADGRYYSANAVVSACDARTTFLDMLEPNYVPATLREKLPRMDLSPSIFQVHLGVDMDLEPYRQDIKRLNFIYPYDDIDKAMANFPNGNVEEAAYFLYVATFHQPEMAPPGMHSLKLEAYTRLNAKGIDWERDKEEIAKVFIRRSEKIIPNLSQHIVTQALRTPADLHNDTGNSEGAFAGWAFTPELLSRERPSQRTPVPGLYLAGHWTTPTAGVPWVMVSGFNTAGMVISDLRRKQGGGGRIPVPGRASR
jgi:phytoene dehydrogenase-like protein